VRGVRSSSIRFDERTAEPTGRLVAYGLHVGGGCRLDLDRAVVADGGYGFFAAQGAALAVRTGVIAHQLDAAGAADVDADGLALDAVRMHLNAVDDVLRGIALPEAASLPTPTPVCLDPSCR
jgi:hypothetical protein